MTLKKSGGKPTGESVNNSVNDNAAAGEQLPLPLRSFEASDAVIRNCSEVQVRIAWFSASAKVDNEDVDAMLQDTGADRNAVAISKRLMASGHAAVKCCLAAKRTIQEYVAAMTIPKVVLTTVGEAEAVRKDAGVRLLQKRHMEEFDQRVRYLAELLKTAVLQLHAQMDDVKASDKERLGSLYREVDYPKDVRKMVSVDIRYKNGNVDVDWKSICPSVYAREAQLAKAEREEVVKNWAIEFSSQLVDYTEQVVQQLSNRVRLNPISTKDEIWRDSEVIERIDEDDVVKVTLRRKDGDKTVTEKKEFPRLVYVNEMRPYETAERRKLYDSTVENMKTQLETFLNTADMFGPYKEPIEKAVRKVQTALTDINSSMDVSKIVEDLRSGQLARKTIAKAMTEVRTVLNEAIVDAKAARRYVRHDLLDD